MAFMQLHVSTPVHAETLLDISQSASKTNPLVIVADRLQPVGAFDTDSRAAESTAPRVSDFSSRFDRSVDPGEKTKTEEESGSQRSSHVRHNDFDIQRIPTHDSHIALTRLSPGSAPSTGGPLTQRDPVIDDQDIVASDEVITIHAQGGSIVDYYLPHPHNVITYQVMADLPSNFYFDRSWPRIISTGATTFGRSEEYTYEYDGGDLGTFSIIVYAETVPGLASAVADQSFTAGTSVSVQLPDASPTCGFTNSVAQSSCVVSIALFGHLKDSRVEYTLRPDLPAGLTFDPTTRTISGIPEHPFRSETFYYTAEDSDGDTGRGFLRVVRECTCKPKFAGGHELHCCRRYVVQRGSSCRG